MEEQVSEPSGAAKRSGRQGARASSGRCARLPCRPQVLSTAAGGTGVWGQSSCVPFPRPFVPRGAMRRLLPGPFNPFQGRPGPRFSIPGPSPGPLPTRPGKRRTKREDERKTEELPGSAGVGPAGVFRASSPFTSHLDKILITAPKLSALTFIKAAPPARPPSASLPALPSMEVNFEYMIYLAGRAAPRRATFSKGGQGSEL